LNDPKANDEWQSFELRTNAISAGYNRTKRVFVLSASFARRGTIFIFERGESGPFRLAWDIKDAARHSQIRDINVWDDAIDIEGWGSGPLTGTVMLLPQTSNGNLRFGLDATTNPEAGGTYTQQISVWEWNGKEAFPEFIKPYSISVSSSHGVELKKNMLRVGVKEDLKTFFSCGQCAEPEAIWNLEITPNGVKDRGARFIQPEYKFIDDLLYRILKRETVQSMASDRVTKTLQSILPEIKNEKDEGGHLLGMLSGMTTKQKGQYKIVDIEIDSEWFSKLRFTLSHLNGKLFAVDVKRLQ
jgi:hypothetical protein